MKKLTGKKIKVGKKFYYRDNAGNLISADYVKDAPVKITQPTDILPFLSEERTDNQENFIVITLDANNQVINKHLVTKGLVNQSQIHPRETFYRAIKDNSVSIIIAHNHPSGSLEASSADLQATRRLVDAGNLLGISILDHIILTSLGHKSIRESHPTYFH